MNKIYLIFALFLLGFGAAIAQPAPQADPTIYVCGPCNGDCDKLQFDKPGVCPHCGMTLVKTKLSDFKKMAAAEKPTVEFYLQDGVEVLDFAGPMEVFIAAGFNVFTVSKNYKPLHSQTILYIIPDYTIDDAPPADVLAVFGGNTGPGVIDDTVTTWIKKQNVKSYFSVCTGAFILGRAGLLDNLTATTYHLQIDNLAKEFPKTRVLANTRFVDDGSVITTAGISAGIDGALHLVEKLRGRAFAENIAKLIEYDKWVPGNGLVLAK